MLLLPSLSTARKLPSLLALSLALLLSSAAAAHAALTFTPINDPLGTKGTSIYGVNGAFMVGSYLDGNNTNHGFVYNGTGFVTLDDPNPNAMFTDVRGVDGPNVVGFVDTNTSQHAFLYNSNGFVEFDVAGGANTTAAYDISGNNVVGNYYDGNTHGFIYNLSNETTTTLDDPSATMGAGGTYATGIDGTVVVGYYYTGSLNSPVAHGFFYNSVNGTYTTISDPKAGSDDYEGTFPAGVSNGIIVGYYYDGNFTAHGFVYGANGQFTDLDKPGPDDTYVSAIDGSTVVGYTQDMTYHSSGFVVTLATSSNTTPSISASPKNQLVAVGANATFTATVNLGKPTAKLQWQVFISGAWTNITAAAFKSGSFSGNFSGFNSASLTVVKPLAALDGKQFRLLAFNSAGNIVSSPATLNVTVPTINISSISVKNQTSTDVQSSNNIFYPLANQAVVFKVTASGAANLTYQWFLNGKAISKATSSTYTITKFTATNAGAYSVVVTNPPSGAANDAGPVNVQLGITPAFAKSPANTTIADGSTGNFTVSFAASPTPTIKWQSSPNGTTWSDLANSGPYTGVTTATLHITANSSLNGLKYRAIITNAFTSVTSTPGTLTVTPAPLPSNLQGKYTIKILHISALSGLISANITPLPAKAQSFNVTLDAKGLAGTTIPTAADNLITSVGPGSNVSLTPTSTPTPTTYNATLSGTIVFVLGSIDYEIALDKTKSAVSAGFVGSNLVVTAQATGAITQAGTSTGTGTAIITITLSK